MHFVILGKECSIVGKVSCNIIISTTTCLKSCHWRVGSNHKCCRCIDIREIILQPLPNLVGKSLHLITGKFSIFKGHNQVIQYHKVQLADIERVVGRTEFLLEDMAALNIGCRVRVIVVVTEDIEHREVESTQTGNIVVV